MTTTAATVFIATSSLSPSDPVQYALDGMTGYDDDIYRDAIAEDGIDQVVEEEWTNVWTQGDNACATREAAEEYVEETQHGTGHVVELTRADVRVALERAFGDSRRLGRYTRQLLSHKRSGDVIAIEINNETTVVRATGALHHSEQDLPLSEYEIDEIELGLNLDDWDVLRCE